MTDVRDRYHGHPYEVVIPCMTLQEANEEKADLNVAAEARAFIREATQTGGVLERDQARAVLHDLLPGLFNGSLMQDEMLDRLAGCVRPAAIDRDALSTILRSYGVDGDALDEALDRIEATQ